jgi:thioredoxin 1
MILTDENFDKEIASGEKPVLVDFFAEWCGPCGALSPILEKIAADYADKIVLAKVNVDSAPVSSQKYQVSSIPAVFLFKAGKSISGFVGAQPEEFIKKWLDENL